MCIVVSYRACTLPRHSKFKVFMDLDDVCSRVVGAHVCLEVFCPDFLEMALIGMQSGKHDLSH